MLDKALHAFNESMRALAEKDIDFDYDNVTTFQASDFNRTWTPNSTDVASAGTDHAWGSPLCSVGRSMAVNSSAPSLSSRSVDDDVPSGSRGRWIPTTSVDQFAAVLANWFGVPFNSSEMDTIFPNLYRFQNPFNKNGTYNEAANLGFLKA